MPPSVVCAVAMQGLADSNDVPECVGCDCEALGIESCETKAIDELHSENPHQLRFK
jgi:hypothetical protein